MSRAYVTTVQPTLSQAYQLGVANPEVVIKFTSSSNWFFIDETVGVLQNFSYYYDGFLRIKDAIEIFIGGF